MLAAFCCAAAAAPAASPAATSPCADPAADIELALIARTGPGAGRVRITAVVRNLGGAAWTAAGPAHHLQMELARRDAGTPPEGKPVQPAVAIRQLAPGEQYRIDYQTDWNADVKASRPRFIARFFETGRTGDPAVPRHDCRTDNNRREIAVADIDRLFQAAPESPLSLRSFRLLGGVGVNTLEAHLAWRRGPARAGKLSASVAAPYAGIADEVPLEGDGGTAKIRVHIPCDAGQTPGPRPAPVVITYRLWSTLGLPGGAGWVPGFSVEHAIPYHELCGPAAGDASR